MARGKEPEIGEVTMFNVEDIAREYYQVYKRQGKKLTPIQKTRLYPVYKYLLDTNYRLDLYTIVREMYKG